VSLGCARCALLFRVLLPLPAWADLHHALVVVVRPDQHVIEVIDTITRPATASATLEFELHPDLAPEIAGEGVRLEALAAPAADKQPASNMAAEAADVTPRHYRVLLPAGQDQFVLRYRGRIQHALRQQGEDYARGFRETAGMIDGEGVFLAAESYWYPRVAGERLTFDLDLSLPPGWTGMTQGERLTHTTGETRIQEQWRCPHPQEEIYLIAGRFSEYAQSTDGVQAMVLLREPDAALARSYLDATAEYIRLYSGLIGPYPYAKFALVENFWETGYGMPSFTLLGSKVIRLPFILHSSYPHEILHNWWGNGVFVDADAGNWSEGLTAYLADHLMQEQRGAGAEYRRAALQKYADYVSQERDFPLAEFRARHSAATEAVGYGKALMVFHMVRRELGDEAFIRALRGVFERFRFRRATFADLDRAFAAAAGRPGGSLLAPWIEKAGAPALKVGGVKAFRQGADRYLVTALVEQTQPGAAYRLRVPVAVTLEGREQAYQTTFRLDTKRLGLELPVEGRPLRLDIDPEFDLFRRLDRAELPPALSGLFGAERLLIVLPAAAPEPLREGYRRLADAWKASQPGQTDVVFDEEVKALPVDRAVWLFGWENHFRPAVAASLPDRSASITDTGVRLGGRVLVPFNDTALGRATHSAALAVRDPAHPDRALGWLAADRAAALPGLGRKLPHYGKYGYLVFEGDEPTNVVKGEWPVGRSPLSALVASPEGETRDVPRARRLP
jgi:hypothetical protein